MSTARKIAQGAHAKKVTVRELANALKSARRSTTGLTQQEREAVREGERYRKSGRRGISLDEAEAILQRAK